MLYLRKVSLSFRKGDFSINNRCHNFNSSGTDSSSTNGRDCLVRHIQVAIIKYNNKKRTELCVFYYAFYTVNVGTNHTIINMIMEVRFILPRSLTFDS